MDILNESKDTNKKTFFNHIFSTTEEGKAEILNVVQYSVMGVIPVVILNKLIQRFIPEADGDKSSVELIIEIFLQLIIMFCGIILIHRFITYFPSYSGFTYDHLMLTNVVLAFLIIVLSIQTKLGIKVNILVDRLVDLWNGTSSDDRKTNAKNNVRVSQPLSQHISSQADFVDNTGMQSGMFPPAPIVNSRGPTNGTYDTMMRGNGANAPYEQPVMPANFSGSVFGSSF